MKILAIETATAACSAALLLTTSNNEKSTIVSRFQLAPREHTKLILPMLEDVLEEASISLIDLDAIAFSRGPGAFTGLRIAAGVAQGIALSAGKPVISVSTLAALAEQVHEHDIDVGTVIAALDARMGEVYWGRFSLKNGKIIEIDEEKVTKPEEMMAVALKEKQVIAIGMGWDAYKDSLFKKGAEENILFIEKQYPHAEAIAKVAMKMFFEGKATPPENAQPVYIRNKIAEKTVDRVKSR